MIEVTILETGDCAEAETPEAALLAAQVMGREAQQARGTWGFDPTVRFEVDGEVAAVTSLRALGR